MCSALVWSFDAITGLPWLEIIKAFAPVATAVIAFRALQNWKRQDKAKREVEFLDELLDVMHEYINHMSIPMTHAEMIRIGINAHAPTWEGGDTFMKGAIAYIDKQGPESYKRLHDALERVRPSVARLESLIAKGQVFGFKSYAQCHGDVRMLTWVYRRLDGFAGTIGGTAYNWENPELVAMVRRAVDIDVVKLRSTIEERKLLVIGFVTETYSQIYGGMNLRARRKLAASQTPQDRSG